MLSFFDSLFGREPGETSAEGGLGRSETLLRETIAANSRITLALSMAATPAALYMLVHAALMPFVITVTGLGAGFLTLMMHRSGHFERAAWGQVCGTLIIGIVLTLVDPQLIDFGLAIALLAPVQATLLIRRPAEKRTWVMLLAAVSTGCLGAIGLVTWPEPVRSEYPLLAGLAFIATALIVAFTASRNSAGFAVYERGQVNAYRDLIENVRDAVMRFAADGSVVYTSRSAEALFGCRLQELSRAGLVERIHVLDRPVYMTAFSDTNHGGKGRTVEVRMRRDDPTNPSRIPVFSWIEVALMPVLDEQAPHARNEVVAVLRDITERQRQESEMREARRVAEDASKAKSRFLATMGHELRTPLNAIVGFSELMTSGMAGELSRTHREYAEIIHRSGNHLLDVVRMLLDMSRLEAGKFEINTEAFDPAGLIEPCFSMVETMARERQVRLVTELSRNLPALIGDERAVRQILINLLSNAIKFSHEQGTVTVAIRRQGASLNISVIDRGIGMDENAVSRVGEPFFQVQDGLSRRYEGTGLGLSIVKGLVDLHQGSLRVLSVPGEGTTVTVLLPINGPETKTSETAEVTQIIPREPVVARTSEWPDEKRRAL